MDSPPSTGVAAYQRGLSTGSPRLYALLSWFDEDVDMLRECVESLRGVVDAVIAVDGAYALFPHAVPYSPTGQAIGIKSVGIPTVMAYVDQAWMGNQAEKRTFMFDLAAGMGVLHEDWLMVIDADETFTVNDVGVFRRSIAQTRAHVGIVPFRTARGVGRSFNGWEQSGGEVPKPRLFRLLDGLRVDHAHNVYLGTAADGTVYSLNSHRGGGIEPGPRFYPDGAPAFTHHVLQRDEIRNDLKAGYYGKRLDLGVDVGYGSMSDMPHRQRAQLEALKREAAAYTGAAHFDPERMQHMIDQLAARGVKVDYPCDR